MINPDPYRTLAAALLDDKNSKVRALARIVVNLSDRYDELRAVFGEADRHGTLGELRELTFDLPDDTLIEVSIRKAHDPDHFYEPVLVEDCISVRGRPSKQVVCFDAPEPRDFDA